MHRSQWELLYWQRPLIQTSHGKHAEGRAQERKQMRNVSLSTVDGDSFPFLIRMQKYTEHCQHREFTQSLLSRSLRHYQRGIDIPTRLTSVSSTPGSWADILWGKAPYSITFLVWLKYLNLKHSVTIWLGQRPRGTKTPLPDKASHGL